MQPTSPLLSRAARKLRLTTKQAGHNYYKGTGSGSMGRHTKHGGFVVEWHKVRTYVVPQLEGFHMTPFVSKRIEEPEKPLALETDRSGDWHLGPLSGKRWLDAWRREGRDRVEESALEGGEVVLGQ